jgi:hypothetical protein
MLSRHFSAPSEILPIDSDASLYNLEARGLLPKAFGLIGVA